MSKPSEIGLLREELVECRAKINYALTQFRVLLDPAYFPRYTPEEMEKNLKIIQKGLLDSPNAKKRFDQVV